MSIAESFSRVARDYDRQRRRLIPGFDDYYGAALDLLDPAATASGLGRVLDLGAGTGLFAAMVAERFPGTRLTLIDLSEGMLAQARERFGMDAREHIGEHIQIITADYATAPLGGPYDAIISGLSIHHLEDPGKRALFVRLFQALKPGGRFVNADQVSGLTPALDAAYRRQWVARVRALGVTEGELAAAFERMRYDRLAPLADQLEWLAEAGFTEVDCVYKNWSFVVYSGVRPG